MPIQRDFKPTLTSPSPSPSLPSAHLSTKSREAISQPPMALTPQTPNETWAGAISRLQTQVSYNTSMHESHRRQVGEIEQAVGRLQQEMAGVIAVLGEVRAELRGRPSNAETSRADPGDLDLLASQIASVTTKTNEVDSIKMQVELLKNRMKRLEEHGSPAAPHLRPRTGSAQREHYEQQTQSAHLSHPPTLPPPPPPPPPHHVQSLPPIRTAASAPNASPRDERTPNFNGPPPSGLSSQSTVSIRAAPSPRLHTTEAHPQSAPPPAAGFRPAESLPPPPAISGWRSADGFPPHSPAHAPVTAPSTAPPPSSARPSAIEPETQSGRWASVNANHASKRPFDEARPPQFESPSLPGSPKRPKLAPIMPRNNYPEEGYPHPHPHPHPHLPPHVHPHPHSHPHPHPALPPPPPAGLAHHPSQDGHYHPPGHHMPDEATSGGQSFRFVTSTGEGKESWVSEHERMLAHNHDLMGPGRGRGRGGRVHRGTLRGRGRGRGGGVIMQTHDGPDMSPHEWAPPHGSPNGFYHPVHPHSPQAGVLRRVGGMPGDMPMHEFPATPIHVHDPFAVQDSSLSSGKKSRTKPFRNAEGILIRKDGRPDMRSVSSANNLRRVHAKKELERAELEGRTPTSARSLAPAHSNSLSEDGDGPLSQSPASNHRGGDGRHEEGDDEEEGEEEGEEGEDEEDVGEDGIHDHTDTKGDGANGRPSARSTHTSISRLDDTDGERKTSDRFHTSRHSSTAPERHGAEDVHMENDHDTHEARKPVLRDSLPDTKPPSADVMMDDENQSAPYTNGIDSRDDKQIAPTTPTNPKDSGTENVPPVTTTEEA